jgi:hypothetical protein
MKRLLAFCLVSLFSAPAFAQGDPNDIYLGEPGYGGSGCPDGTVSAILSPDAKTLSILFDEYYAETERGKTRARAACNVAVPVHVPQGLSISLVEVDYRGYAEIPSGGRGEFRVEYFFAGQRGPSRTARFRSNYMDDFLIEDNLLIGATVWSPCGADVILRSNSSLIAQKRSRNSEPEAFMVVDSADFEAGIQYQLQWRRCN